MREVMAHKGVTLPDGVHLPKGTWAGATAIGVHSDESLYSNPSQYEPFRFVAGGQGTADLAREENGASKKVSFLPVEGDEKKEQRIQSIPTINENFLSFGLGKHAWFVLLLYSDSSILYLLCFFTNPFKLVPDAGSSPPR